MYNRIKKNSLVIYRMTNAAAPNAVPASPHDSGVASTASPVTAAPSLVKGGSKKRHSSKKGGNSKQAGGKKSRKMPSAAKSWVKFVLEIFNKNRAKNPNYKYKQAMKDAAKLKKKNKTMKAGGEVDEPKPEEQQQ
jgi:hypothetical protein